MLKNSCRIAANLSILLLTAAGLVSCRTGVLTLTVTNPGPLDRVSETVEIPLEQLQEKMGLEETGTFKIENSSGEEIAYQLTSDRTLIFPVDLQPEERLVFTIRKGIPSAADTLAYGQVYPERLDDLAWENDEVAFRAYGPALQRRGDQAFGYDIFARRGPAGPALPEMYRMETNKEIKAQMKMLRENGNTEEADKLNRSRSYHVDHGHGMDCYAVGPTLGAGAAALVEDGEIVYPWCYEKYEILDNGPLRFKVRLTFTPLKVAGRDDIIETRLITLDAGAHLNKTEITYSGITEKKEIVSGIVMHDHTDLARTEAEEGWISYQDPTTGPGKGLLYLGHAVDHALNRAEVNYFPDEESVSKHKSTGHVLAYDCYDPAAAKETGSGFTYWWGFGWSKSDMPSYEDWNNYMRIFAAQLRQPLQISIQ